jgi:hypothetical protein
MSARQTLIAPTIFFVTFIGVFAWMMIKYG